VDPLQKMFSFGKTVTCQQAIEAQGLHVVLTMFFSSRTKSLLQTSVDTLLIDR